MRVVVALLLSNFLLSADTTTHPETQFGGSRKAGFQKGGLADVLRHRKPERGYKKTERRTPKLRTRVQKTERTDPKNRNEGTFAKTTLFSKPPFCFLSNNTSQNTGNQRFPCTCDFRCVASLGVFSHPSS